MDLFYFPAQVVWMPETNQLKQNTAILIFGIDQDEIWHHHRVSEQEYLAFTR